MKQAAFPLFETSERGPVILSCLWGGGREGVQRIVGESNGFYWERRISHRQQSLKREGGKGGSLENYIHSLREGSGKLYCGTTKIPRPHTPVISNDRSLVKLKS